MILDVLLDTLGMELNLLVQGLLEILGCILNEMDALVQKVKCYRGGYTKASRRCIEREMFCGKLIGVVGTIH